MAPLGYSLENDYPGMGGFIYKDLYNQKEGQRINWFNCQCYSDNLNLETLINIKKNGYPTNKIVLGMLSDMDSFNDILTNLKEIHENKVEIGGVFVWEYFDAPPDLQNHYKWASIINNIINS